MYQVCNLTYLRALANPYKKTLPNNKLSIVRTTTATSGSEDLGLDSHKERMGEDGEILSNAELPHRTPEQARAAQHVAETMRNATHNRVVALEGEVTKLRELMHDRLGSIDETNHRLFAMFEQLSERMLERSQTTEAADLRKKTMVDVITTVASSSLIGLLSQDSLQQTALQAILEKQLTPTPTLEEVKSLWESATMGAQPGGSGSQTTAPKTSRPSEGWQSVSKKPRTEHPSDKSPHGGPRCRNCRGFKKPGQSWADHAVDCAKAIKADAERKMALATKLESQMQE
ncbi:hypothetical protein Vretimale_19838 [Volvox reticuliferus]|uniref:Uncharacterized protein n=1 Tax=Volvox reticuliferus TaxID=1737510 RepID=A0A8J4CZX5_9CHLO|nr:hypothetical protein Vretifemale_19901 [Volvox reticuliferus]GIM17303.1 hypothetical protein Vretimale_19838 [Volvox reticuliferus]